jgi:hypothetical protein
LGLDRTGQVVTGFHVDLAPVERRTLASALFGPGGAGRRVVHDYAVDHTERRTESRIVIYELAALAPST